MADSCTLVASKPLSFVDAADSKTSLVTGGAVAGASTMHISVREYGNPNATKAILFIHGFSQNHLCWYNQLASKELSGYRLIAIDLRGHGNSDKTVPTTLATGNGYAPDDYADDIKAVMDAKNLVRPVLVGWSYGGMVICDYLRKYGTTNVGGLNFVGAASRLDGAGKHTTDHLGAGLLDNVPDLLTEDAAINLRGTINFLNACVAKPLSQDDFAMMLGTNMLVPVSARLALLLRPDVKYDESLLKGMTLPTLITHGTADKAVLPASARAINAAITGSELSLYEGIGHATFLEEPARFNKELAAFRAKI